MCLKVKFVCSNGHELGISKYKYPSRIKAEEITHPELRNYKDGDVLLKCPDCNASQVELENIIPHLSLEEFD